MDSLADNFQVAYAPTEPYSFGFYNSTNYPASLDLGGTDSWIIATAEPTPEPATLALLGSALLGLGVVYLRRRRAKA